MYSWPSDNKLIEINFHYIKSTLKPNHTWKYARHAEKCNTSVRFVRSFSFDSLVCTISYVLRPIYNFNYVRCWQCHWHWQCVLFVLPSKTCRHAVCRLPVYVCKRPFYIYHMILCWYLLKHRKTVFHNAILVLRWIYAVSEVHIGRAFKKNPTLYPINYLCSTENTSSYWNEMFTCSNFTINSETKRSKHGWFRATYFLLVDRSVFCVWTLTQLDIWIFTSEN